MKERINSLIIVDVQRGFMPASEGDRLKVDGFGELGVQGGEAIVTRVNALTRAIGQSANSLIATTQDWHPTSTAHFSSEPNYIGTWPVHCVGNTPGAELHPDLIVATQPEIATRFIKGDLACESPADDTSYTGALAYNPITKETLPDYLRSHEPSNVYVTGLALGDGDKHPLCVDSTARDLSRDGFNITLITDATEAVFPDNRERCFRNLAREGIRLITTEQALMELTGDIS